MPRKPNYYAHEGRQIHGLIRRKDGRFTPAGRAGRGVYFGRDPIEAMRLYRLWSAKQADIPTVAVKAFKQLEPGVHLMSEKATALMADEDFWSMVTDLIWNQPKYVAERTGREEIAYLDKIKPPGESIRLDAVVDLWEGRKKVISKPEITHGLTTWKMFVNAIRKVGPAERFIDITREQVEYFHERMHALKLKSKTLSGRLNKLRQMLKYVDGKTDDKHIERVRKLTDLFETNGNGSPRDPNPISKKDYLTLLKTATKMTFEEDKVNGTLWNAMLLIAANCCFYGKDLKDLKPKHIDFKNGTLTYRRGKTGIARVAVLWKRTIKAIEDYQKACPHELNYIFANYDHHDKQWRPLNDTTIIRQFGKIVKKAKLPDLTFSQLRDGGGTAAAIEGASERDYKIIMGHSCGMSDAYIMRNPMMVEKTCKLMEKYLFSRK